MDELCSPCYKEGKREWAAGNNLFLCAQHLTEASDEFILFQGGRMGRDPELKALADICSLLNCKPSEIAGALVRLQEDTDRMRTEVEKLKQEGWG